MSESNKYIENGGETIAPAIPDGSIPRTLTPLEDSIACLWNQILPIHASAPTDDFYALGGDSLFAARMLAAVQTEFALDNRLWEHVEFFDSPTLAALAQIVGLCLQEKDQANLAAFEKEFEDVSAAFLQAHGQGPPVLFFPGEDLGAAYLRHLARALGNGQPFIVLSHKLADTRGFGEVASHLVKLILGIRSRSPMVLAGHCYGGVVAFDVARRLRAEGEGEVALVLIDAPAPGLAKIRLKSYLRYLPIVAKEVLRGRGKTLIKEAIEHAAFLKRRHYNVRVQKSGQSDFANDLSPEGRLVQTYIPQPFHGKATHILARETMVSSRILKDPRLGWRDLMGDALEEHWIRGDHNSIFKEPNVAILAERLGAVLQAFER